MLIDCQSFCYTKKDTKGSRTFWQCTKRDSKRCNARATTTLDGKMSLSGEHNHLSDIIGVDVKLKEQEIHQKAVTNPCLNPRAVLGELTSLMNSPAEMAHMSLSRNFVRRIQYARQSTSREFTLNECLSRKS